ncbi:Uu.00g013020.m01.CDS01 [Anthostomella pinea]|uniref:Uu.00g013020.m01.CDS01 n=1 Tax=Anthostomella pinea TaxID=933095 RepID=A0AAI8VZA2_9PEZI|nr:Uu.00g013020.m01.CDS01 [Anthostomella pinea]
MDHTPGAFPTTPLAQDPSSQQHHQLGEVDHTPGAFPTTLAAEDESSSSSYNQHREPNKLHKREDPRGWSQEEQLKELPLRNQSQAQHQHQDSGIGMADNNPPRRTVGMTDSTGLGASRKPAVMTGAYSRVHGDDQPSGQQHQQQQPSESIGTKVSNMGSAALASITGSGQQQPSQQTTSGQQQTPGQDRGGIGASALSPLTGSGQHQSSHQTTPGQQQTSGEDRAGIGASALSPLTGTKSGSSSVYPEEQPSRQTSYPSQQQTPSESRGGIGAAALSPLTGTKSGSSSMYSEQQPESSQHQHQTQGLGVGQHDPAISCEDHEHEHDLNTVRSGLSDKSNVGHSDPYWGDVPYGTGVYNGVKGHGSDEVPPPTHEHHRSPTDAHEQGQHEGQRAIPLGGSSGIYNNVIGHGSDEAPADSHHDPLGQLDDQRAAPPGHESTAGSTPLDPNFMQQHRQQNRDSHLKEGLAGAGAGAGVGYAAHELADRHRGDRDPQGELQQQRSNVDNRYEQPEAQRESHVGAGGLYYGDALTDAEKKERGIKTHEHEHRHKEPKEEKDFNLGHLQEKDRSTEDPSKSRHEKEAGMAAAGAAAAYGAHEHDKDNKHEPTKTHEESPKEKKGGFLSSLFHRGHKDDHHDDKATKATPAHHDKGEGFKDPFVAAGYHKPGEKSTHDRSPTSAVPGERQHNQHDNKLGYAAGVAGLGAGATGVYAAHKHGEKDEGSPTDASGRDREDPYRAASVAASGSPQTNRSQAPGQQYDHLASGTPSGVDLGHSSSHSNIGANRGSTDSAHGGMYKTLSSGTPSGVNVEPNQRHHHHHHESGRQSYDPTSSATSPTATGDRYGDHSGAKAAALGAAGAGAGAAGYQQYAQRDQREPELQQREMSQPEQKRFAGLDELEKTRSSGSLPGAGGAGSGLAPSGLSGNGYGGGSGSGSGGLGGRAPVLHKCKNCGEDNDISSYFQK